VNRSLNLPPRIDLVHHDALEARFGLRVCARLNEAGDSLPHDVSERLRVARDLAVGRARALRKTQLQTQPRIIDAVVNADGTLSPRLFGGETGEPWWVRLSALAPLLLLVAGLLLISNWERHEQISAAAEIDAALLSDDLPPQAYTDPGFDEYLKSGESLPSQ
jgi:hypothetical protein